MYNPSSYYPDATSYSRNLLQLITPYLKQQKKCCLFLDIDGTLSEFHPDPSRSFIPETTLTTLQQLSHFDVAVIFVTGRSVPIAEKLISPLKMPIAGTHGLEIKIHQDLQLNTAPEDFDLSIILQEFQKLCRPYPQLLIEKKAYSVALHYRQCPELAEIAQQIAETIQLRYSGLKINTGKFVFELLPQQADKGNAIEKILQHLNFSDALPIFIGDDRTDESGFKMINRYQGISIKVGPEATNAHYRLHNVADVADFLDLFSQLLEARFLGLSQVSNGEKACLD